MPLAKRRAKRFCGYLFAEEVIDAVDVGVVEAEHDVGIECARRREVVPEGFR